jgi:Tfp pilus assembly protein PilN
MTILAAGDKTVVRVARVPAGEIGAESRRTAIAETSRAAGLKPSEVRTGDEWLMMEPAPVSVRILGETRSPEWIAHFGLAGAAISAFADPNPAVRAHVGLHETEPKAKPPVLQRISEWAGGTSRAAVIGVACVLLAVGVPIGVSMAKVRLLEKQIRNEKELLDQNAKDDADLRFAKALKERRWPMTKLLSDIAGACPVGVTIDSVEIEQGAPVSIRGLAPDSDKLSTFRSNLDATKVFSDIANPQNNPTEKGVQFQITAKILPGAALTIAKPAEDFVTNPLVVRLYGESARGAAGTSHSNPRTERTDRTDRTSRDRRNNNGGSGSSRPSTRETTRDNPARTDRSSSTPSKPAAVPGPLSDEAIAKLSRDQAMLEWTKRKAASKQAGLDEATRTRLMAESDKAKARMEAASGGGQ